MSAAASEPDGGLDAIKRAAAQAAVDLVEDGMVIGLGTGSTAAFAVEALARRHREGVQLLAIPTSEWTRAQAEAASIPLTSFSEQAIFDARHITHGPIAPIV